MRQPLPPSHLPSHPLPSCPLPSCPAARCPLPCCPLPCCPLPCCSLPYILSALLHCPGPPAVPRIRRTRHVHPQRAVTVGARDASIVLTYYVIWRQPLVIGIAPTLPAAKRGRWPLVGTLARPADWPNYLNASSAHRPCPGTDALRQISYCTCSRPLRRRRITPSHSRRHHRDAAAAET